MKTGEETGGTAIVSTERSLEARVGDKAVKKLRIDLELTHPELHNLFFVPEDFAVFYGIEATLEKIDASVTEKKYENFLIKRLRQYLDKSAKPSRRNRISAKLHGEDKQHLYVDRTKLTRGALRNLTEQVYKTVFSKQLKRVDEIQEIFYFEQDYDYDEDDEESQQFTTPLQEKLEDLIKEATSFIRNFSVVPVNELIERTNWDAIIPTEDYTKILFGAYERKQAKPFHASGKSFTRSQSENTMPQYTLLEPQYGDVLSDKLFMRLEDFNAYLKQLVGQLKPYVKKEANLPNDLQVNLALFNYLINGLYLQKGNQLSGSYVAGINMALRGIDNHLKDVFSFIMNFELEDFDILRRGYLEWKVRNMIKEKTDFELIYHKPPLGDSYYIAKKPLTK